MKKILLTVCVMLVSAGCNRQSPAQIKNTSDYNHGLQIGQKKILVQVVSTAQEMEQGLSGEKNLTDEQGMLFDFSNYPDKRPAFWMKDMLFNLDLIWIKDKKIIAINRDVSAPVNCQSSIVNCHLPTYSPPSDIDSVLEVNAGWSEKYNAKVGDEVMLIN